MELIKNKYQNLFFLPEKQLFEWTWAKETLLMSEDEFKKETLTYAEKVLEHKPKYLFINTIEMEFVIDPPLQLWYTQNIAFKTAQAGVQKISFLVSRDIFVQMSVKQTEDEIAVARKTPNPIEIKYFENEKEARDWLF